MIIRLRLFYTIARSPIDGCCGVVAATDVDWRKTIAENNRSLSLIVTKLAELINMQTVDSAIANRQDLSPTIANAARLGLLDSQGNPVQAPITINLSETQAAVLQGIGSAANGEVSSPSYSLPDLWDLGTIHVGASDAQNWMAGLDSMGKATGAAKLLPAGILQKDLALGIMGAKDVGAAQSLIKSSNAKSALALAGYLDEYKGVYRKLHWLGTTLTVAEEADRFNRAQGWAESTKVVGVGVLNAVADAKATAAGAWLGAKYGAIGGAAVCSVIPVAGTVACGIVGGVVGGIGGGVGGHIAYDKLVAPKTREIIIGKDFRDE